MSEFKKGDRVQVKPEHDETLQILGARTPPGTVEYIEHGHYVMVALDDEHGNEAQGQGVPYPPSELVHL